MKKNRVVEDRIDELMGFDSTPESKPKRFKVLWAVYLLLFVSASVFIYHYIPQQPAASSGLGKITSLTQSAVNPREIIVAGFTKDFPPDRPYSIITVDVERLRLCWPKKPLIKPNSSFRLSFYEGGPSGKCCISLYAVNQDYYNKVMRWFKEQRLGGMPLLPASFLIDTKSIDI